MTHRELVELGYKWILKGRGCGVAFKELKSYAKEIPDVIGFGHGCSTVIECKASRNDFLNDKNKIHRKRGMGVFRYYLCPSNLISIDDLPEKWGLLWATETGKIKVLRDPKKTFLTDEKNYNPEEPEEYWTAAYMDAFKRDLFEEQKIMYTALRRLFIKGHMDCIYDKNYSSLTSLRG